MNERLFFETDTWLDVLNTGFGAYSRRINDLLTATVFRAGPLSVAYVNFPIGIRTPEAQVSVEQSDTRRALEEMGGDLLRYSVPETLVQGQNSSVLSLPETCIFDLSKWSEETLDGDVRYEIRRSRRENTTIRPARIADARLMFDLYLQTISRHDGRKRYTQRYFEALCQLAESTPVLCCNVAETANGIPCGFVITAKHGDDTFYLHAAFDRKHSQTRASYALLATAIAQARESGSTCFNLMASPAHQKTLVNFKEKWGGQSHLLHNFDIPISAIGQIARLGLQLSQHVQWLRRN